MNAHEPNKLALAPKKYEEDGRAFSIGWELQCKPAQGSVASSDTLPDAEQQAVESNRTGSAIQVTGIAMCCHKTSALKGARGLPDLPAIDRDQGSG
jgi:hypothetical protein